MHITDLLDQSRVNCDAEAGSKKRALELLSELIAKDSPSLDPNRVFDQLIERERLGSTGLGHGVAIPHCRIEGGEETLGALIKLHRPIDFDANDGAPVDLLFALVVPAESTDEHLQILSRLAMLFSNESLRVQLREAVSCEGLFKLISHWEESRQSA
ncbi:PTS IIA-like nitrogen-regulatory protein PtsN [Solemya pervernicosa gill symbiont]|uniref:PTS IIA-like nitrogen-regulatory protein PtsN n=2 Tax=Gammaproteobacteria incertae sedis TaxID=118884 RepID=A0A1T2L700_9GAMM|nr:PTS IIA-like nitrogen regulatory protein PtsN [Candidatus Reidiella endopervernicosa]OOZ40879.1 PTS IIA-like nitrogen-regulatory protein PtsN [Solemya pervernicosa gill symbiont]QKQ26153.1 PTS IIA-like nitrogen regulatory protein PtsN [Candidatus Reidiella endopervernicosa]